MGSMDEDSYDIAGGFSPRNDEKAHVTMHAE